MQDSVKNEKITPQWAVDNGFEVYEDNGDIVSYMHECFPDLILCFDHDVVCLEKIVDATENDVICVTIFYDSEDFQYVHQLIKHFEPHYYW